MQSCRQQYAPVCWVHVQPQATTRKQIKVYVENERVLDPSSLSDEQDTSQRLVTALAERERLLSQVCWLPCDMGI
jgi:hypothetical protein